MDKLGQAELGVTAETADKLEKAEKDGIVETIPEASKTKDKTEGNKLPPVNYFELYRFADRTDKILIVVGAFSACAKGAILPLFTVIFGKVLNTFGKNSFGGAQSIQEIQADFQNQVNSVCLYYVYLAIAAGVVAYGEVCCWMLTGTRQARHIKEAYLKAVLRQEVAFFDKGSGSGGDLTSSINEDTLAVQSAIGDKVGNALSNVAMAVTGFAIAFARGWSMTLVILAAVPILAFAGAFIATAAGRLESTMANSYAGANLLAEESLGNMRTVSAFNGQQKTIQEYAKRLAEPERVQSRSGILNGLLMGCVQSIMFFTYALALWFGSTRVLAGEYDGGRVATILFSAIIGGFALGMAAPSLQQIVAGKAAYARLKLILDRKPEIDIQDEGDKPPRIEGHIQLQSVNFVYPARPESLVLRDFTMDVPAGTSFALCGSSGSGKSTVIQLLERFYDPVKGQVLLDGRNIKTLDLCWYRNNVGLVSQEPTLFATDIFSNIAYGRPGATQSEVEEAAQIANAHTFISTLPLGYSTQVGEKGIQLSGGQKQRIAIARAVLKNPKVLLCDEATSALDNKSERIVQKALERLAEGRTTVVVAHRLSTIIHSNQIAVVREGSIVEQGTHSELISKQDGAYSVLVGLQMSALGASIDGDISQKQLSVVEEPAIGHPVLKDVSDPLEDETPELKTGLWWKRVWRKSKKDKDVPKVEAGFGRLARYNKPEWPFFFLGALGSGCLGAIMPFFALALGSMLGAFFSPDRNYLKHQVRIWCGVFIAVGAAGFVGGILQGYCFNLMGARLTKRVRILLMGSLMRQEMAFFDKSENTSGALVARLGFDSTSIRGAVGDQVGILVQNLVTFIAGYVIAFTAGWKMTLVITAVLPLLVFASAMETKFMRGFADQASALYNRANQMASDAFGSCRTVAAYNLRDVIHSSYSQLLDGPEERMRKRSFTSGIGYGLSQFIMFCVYALGFWYGGTLIVKGELSLADMLKVFFAILLAAMGISQARVTFPDISKAAGAVPRVFSVIDRKSAIDSSEPTGDKPETVKGQLELRNVEFAYPERPTITVFKSFDLLIEQGKTVALAGQSGSGKSSIVALVLRFYDPLNGSVLFDGRDIRTLNLSWLRSQMSLVGQEPHLFTGTIRDNIVYGKEDATEQEIIEAAKAANAYDFISNAPGGFNTLVGQDGIQLSGGQRQRIAIARSVIRNPKVLLLDEATSALDATSERIVQEALDRIQTYCTTLVVAHRLSTIRHAHKIAVLQEGQIVEQGSHEELVQKQGGAYRALISQQQRQRG